MRDALTRLGIEGDPLVRAAQEEQFGDYQSNCAMVLAKRLGRKPRELAVEIIAHLSIAELCEPPEIAGPGFINFRITPAAMARRLGAIPAAGHAGVERLGIERTPRPQRVIVDLSSPNLAKEMHVGHLRSTVIGDCIARVLEFAGHEVLRENHVGDWGTQFGMLVAYLRRIRPEVERNPESLIIKDLEAFYVEAKTQFDADDTFKAQSREAVVALQQGDATTRRIWQAFCEESLRHCHALYGRLGVRLVDRGESYYNELMQEVVARLEQRRQDDPNSAVRLSEGALCVFLEGFKTRDGQPLPLIVRKSDGGFNYATSDLATILHRVEHLGATRIIYVVGLSQKQHFEMLFAAARKVGFVGEEVSLHHLGFGNMLSPGGKPFKTREGGTVKLRDLLDEAVERARRVLQEPREEDWSAGRPDRASLADADMQRIAETVGLAAVKYFDLSHALGSDYKFDLDTMLSLEGNTAPYMLYAYARIRSIGRKAGIDFDALPATDLVLEHPAEIGLAKTLLRFAEVVQVASDELKPNVLTDYMYELSRAFSRFYDKRLGVRVIDASPETIRLSRLRLCDLTARTLKLGLDLLGIATLEQM
ncbi:MAG: arginine--tRNA ligase [Planctomycetes bacterium]|nr:arginine--tRNA ligase [Planctomycetota bacterium]